MDRIAGSEGTLAVITAVTLRLAGLPEARIRAAYLFDREIEAAAAVTEMRRYGIDLAAVEFLDRGVMRALNSLKQYRLQELPSLFLEFHGPKEATVSNRDLADTVCKDNGGRQLSLPDDRDPWEIRHYVTEAIKHAQPGYSILRNDVAFPISKLPEMVEFCHKLGRDNDLTMYTFGHVGMGLLHALMLARQDDANEWLKAKDINEKIIAKAVEFGCTISVENGIGLGDKGPF